MDSPFKFSNPLDRFTLFPIKNNDLWNLYKKHLSTFWISEEIYLADDIKDFELLSTNEQFFIKNVLAFFASSDLLVNENLIINFYNEIQIPEVRQFYSVQIMMEAIHSETYNLLIETYIKDPQEKHKLFNAIQHVDIIKKKSNWVLEKMDPKKFSLQHRLLSFICIEGIFFAGSFASIYWLKNKGIMPGLCMANEFISRDESLHAEFAIELYNKYLHKLDKTQVYNIFTEAVNLEKEFITHTLPASLLGMNNVLMKQYIEYVADRWLILLDYPVLFNAENPFSFMEMISLNTKENFFENRVSVYSKNYIGGNDFDKKIEINFDEDF